MNTLEETVDGMLSENYNQGVAELSIIDNL